MPQTKSSACWTRPSDKGASETLLLTQTWQLGSALNGEAMFWTLTPTSVGKRADRSNSKEPHFEQASRVVLLPQAALNSSVESAPVIWVELARKNARVVKSSLEAFRQSAQWQINCSRGPSSDSNRTAPQPQRAVVFVFISGFLS